MLRRMTDDRSPTEDIDGIERPSIPYIVRCDGCDRYRPIWAVAWWEYDDETYELRYCQEACLRSYHPGSVPADSGEYDARIAKILTGGV